MCFFLDLMISCYGAFHPSYQSPFHHKCPLCLIQFCIDISLHSQILWVTLRKISHNLNFMTNYIIHFFFFLFRIPNISFFVSIVISVHYDGRRFYILNGCFFFFFGECHHSLKMFLPPVL